MPRHARDSPRRRWAWSIVRWLVGFAATGGIAAGESVRIADARATVVSGWAGGIVAGAGGGLVLGALVAVMALVQRQHQRPWSCGGRPQCILVFTLILTIGLLLVVALFASTPPRQYGPRPVPYVITSGIEVAEIAYVGIFFAGFAVVLVAWLVAQVRERNPSLD